MEGKSLGDLYLQALRVKLLDCHYGAIALPVGGLDKAFVHTPKPTLSDLEQPAEIIGCVPELLELKNTQVMRPLLIQLGNAFLGGHGT